MLNLYEMKGRLKGELGELLFARIRKFIYRTALFGNDWLDTHKFRVPDNFKLFLREHWNTFDAFSFEVDENSVTNIIFYEIKTSNYRYKRQCLTSNSAKFYKLCLAKGFIVKSALVHIKHDWNFDIHISDFVESQYAIWNRGKPCWV